MGTARITPMNVAASEIWMVTSSCSTRLVSVPPVDGGKNRLTVCGRSSKPAARADHDTSTRHRAAIVRTMSTAAEAKRRNRATLHGGVSVRSPTPVPRPRLNIRSTQVPPVIFAPVEAMSAARMEPETSSMTMHRTSTMTARAIPRW